MKSEKTSYSILLPVALPSSGPELLRLASSLAPLDKPVHYYALHLREQDNSAPEGRGSRANAELYPLQPLLHAASDHRIPVQTITTESESVGQDIAAIADDRDADLILMGWHGPVTREGLSGSAAHEVLQTASADVGLYLCRWFKPWRHVLVPFYGGQHDLGALRLARNLVSRGETQITILHVVPPERSDLGSPVGLKETSEALGYSSEHLKVVEHAEPIEAVVQEAKSGYDLVIIGASEAWGLELNPFSTQHERLARECPASLLVVRKWNVQP